MHIQFSNAAAQAVQLAQGHASRFGHDYVGTEHILLAVVELTDMVDRDGVLRDMVGYFGFTFDKLYAEALRTVATGDCTGRAWRPEASTLLAAYAEAHELAWRLGSDFVRPRHLLLALIPADSQQYERDTTIAACLLFKLGFNFDRARDEAIVVLKKSEQEHLSLAMSDD